MPARSIGEKLRLAGATLSFRLEASTGASLIEPRSAPQRVRKRA